MQFIQNKEGTTHLGSGAVGGGGGLQCSYIIKGGLDRKSLGTTGVRRAFWKLRALTCIDLLRDTSKQLLRCVCAAAAAVAVVVVARSAVCLPGAVGVRLEELVGEEGGAEAEGRPLIAIRLQVADHLQRVATVHLRQLKGNTSTAQHHAIKVSGKVL